MQRMLNENEDLEADIKKLQKELVALQDAPDSKRKVISVAKGGRNKVRNK